MLRVLACVDRPVPPRKDCVPGGLPPTFSLHFALKVWWSHSCVSVRWRGVNSVGWWVGGRVGV